MSAGKKADLQQKRLAAARTIEELAPNAHVLVGMLDETKIDMLLLALGKGHVVAPGEEP